MNARTRIGTARMRLANIQSRCAEPTRRLVGYLTSRRRDSMAAGLLAPPGGVCFGPLDEGDELALRGLTARGNPSVRGPSGERADPHGSEPTG
jgi:hypothetical protein